MQAAPAPPDERDPDPIPLSALQHAVYCLRQAALIHLERMWAENVPTAEGRVLHLAADEPGRRKVRGVRRVNALPLASRRLGIAGVADLVEFRTGPAGETPFPIEIKRGRPKAHEADRVQLCAQALCLEEMSGQPVPDGALFYAQLRRREPVAFDAALRTLTETTILNLRDILASGRTPPPVYSAGLCGRCSLIELCRPKIAARPARAWRQRALAALLDEAGPP